ncbi:phage tail domain-containing protein [Staphylococcus nepalensis]|uniref:Phage tail family protein n=1 Tax=Staphylococcus nepalensis TaxID=214473 RepID=A0A380GQ89_9STAP|nr:phage tail domain-containing protein [Staphylococcus nepalensis]POA00430.1 phage tail protein [Staphylococcus nepalensis]GGB85389.1 holin [Staphylococcus nepalensis]SUM55398.1 phage tail family protein [Staphylococcus nepalensis]VDG67371.1 Phage tail protein [Lacrimispora indolis]
MIDGRWLKIINEDGSKDINEYINDFIFLESKTSYPVVVEDNVTIKGVDGELPGAVSFAPFNLIVKFGLDGLDEVDINLMELKLRSIFFKRKPYYIVTSDNPGIKFKVNNPDVNPDYADFSMARFEMTFSVKDGYAESLKDTNQFSLSSGDWQFEAVARADNSIKYTHTSDYFDIYNGSSDTIDPLLRHKLQIQIKADAPNGITIRNLTTEDKFVYKKPLTPSKTLTIQGVHPILDGNRVGIDTNWQWITLAPGYNTIKIEDDSIISVETKWSFNFIYR